MNRLTMPQGICQMVSTDYCFDKRDCYECGHGRNVFKRLSAYEDTGLTPTEVAEYAKAKADGRAVILPDIPYNKTLYWIWGDEIMPVYYRGIRGGCAHNGKYHVTCDMVTKKDRTFSHKDKEFTYKAGDERCFYADDIGKTVFFTREDAEKALKEREQNG